MNRLPRLLQLIQGNAAKPKRFEARTSDGGDTATIYLYDVIDSFWGIAALDFIKELNGLSAPTINLRINSPGGDVFDARAIATALKAHPSNIVASIDGLAASAATYVALAADEVEIADGAFLMIHQSWSLAFGNATDFRALADLLDKIDVAIVNDYAKKTGKTQDELMAWMAAETWFTAQEALDNGFVDRLMESATANNQWDLAAYDHAPKALMENLPNQREHLERRLKLYDKVAA